MGFVPNSVAPSIPIAHPAVGRFLDGFVVVEPSDGGLGLPLHLALEFELLAGTGHEVAQGWDEHRETGDLFGCNERFHSFVAWDKSNQVLKNYMAKWFDSMNQGSQKVVSYQVLKRT